MENFSTFIVFFDNRTTILALTALLVGVVLFLKDWHLGEIDLIMLLSGGIGLLLRWLELAGIYLYFNMGVWSEVETALLGLINLSIQFALIFLVSILPIGFIGLYRRGTGDKKFHKRFFMYTISSWLMSWATYSMLPQATDAIRTYFWTTELSSVLDVSLLLVYVILVYIFSSPKVSKFYLG